LPGSRTLVLCRSHHSLGLGPWTYEGWQGQVYTKPYPKSRFKYDCLAEYATYEYQGEPLFRTVGIDHSFYGPPSTNLLAHYASLLPPGFTACAKVWEDITVPVYLSGLRYARTSGANPHFLDAPYFEDHVLAPFNQTFQGPHCPIHLRVSANKHSGDHVFGEA
jgi:uncharacterized protein YecE (DUF72 family)